jgi:two-component system response regulator FlrC
MQSLARHHESGVPYSVTAEAQQLLQAYPWPGNVRELENVVQRAVVLCTGQTITPAHLLFDEMSSMIRTADVSVSASTIVRETMAAAQPAQPAPAMPGDATPVWEQIQPAIEREQSAAEQPSAFSASAAPPQAIDVDSAPANLQDVIKSSEHAVIMSAIQNTDSREEAARLLGISPRTLRYKLAQLRERGLMLNAA